MMQLLKKISIKIQVFLIIQKRVFSERYIMILFYNKFFFKYYTCTTYYTCTSKRGVFFRRVNDDSII